jgi:hypothetical protein
MAGKSARDSYVVVACCRRVRSGNTKLEQLVVVIEEDVGDGGWREDRLDRVVTLVPELEGVQAGGLPEGGEDVSFLRVVNHILGVADSPTYCDRDITALVPCQV